VAHVLIELNVRTATCLAIRRQVQADQDRLTESPTREDAFHWIIRFGPEPSTLEVREQLVDLPVQELHPLNVRMGG
jgi:hypothetical protein